LSSKNEEIDFFEEGSNLIYEWLSEEERMQLQEELRGEAVRNIAELRPDSRFFRLLRFVQVKYIGVEGWANRISEILEDLNSRKPDFFIEDLIFKDANNEGVSLLKLKGELMEARPKTAFENLLRQLGLLKEFQRYAASPQEWWQEW